MNEILSGMKVLKLYAWEPSFETLIKDTREKELSFLRAAALYNAGTEFIWSLAPFLVAFFSFMTYVYLGNQLDAQTAFVSMVRFNEIKYNFITFAVTLQALFNILRMPMTLCKKNKHIITY